MVKHGFSLMPPELDALAGTTALLCGIANEGKLFQLNHMTFEVVISDGVPNCPKIVTGFRFLRDEGVKNAKGQREGPTHGVDVVIENGQLILDDAWVKHRHLHVYQGPFEPKHVYERLNPGKPWVTRRAPNEFVGQREYDMLIQELAQKLTPILGAQARQRIAARKAELAAARAIEEAQATAHFEANVRRGDLGEDNGDWGMF